MAGRTLRIGRRDVRTVLSALAERRHYAALVTMARLYPRFPADLWRYLSGRGRYPYDIRVRTPLGTVQARLHCRDDMLTVNEIFCRQDYRAPTDLRFAVDLGSNIGISALYFLTRNRTARCHLYEPVPENVAKLRENLAGYEDRYTLHRTAVADTAGRARFGVEATGRYGGIGVDTGTELEVEVVHVDDALRTALAETQVIDMLKIDTEGAELATVAAIDPELARRIRTIVIEAVPTEPLRPEFDQQQHGSVCRLTNRDRPPSS